VFIKCKVGETAAAANQRNLTAKASISNISAEAENDRRESVRKLAQAHEESAQNGSRCSHENLQLLNKSARWVTKWLYLEMKIERFRMCKVAIAMAATVP
jgi:hypothetical protein